MPDLGIKFSRGSDARPTSSRKLHNTLIGQLVAFLGLSKQFSQYRGKARTWSGGGQEGLRVNSFVSQKLFLKVAAYNCASTVHV